jgi:hypothetical protein
VPELTGYHRKSCNGKKGVRLGTQNLLYDYLHYFDGEELLKPLTIRIYDHNHVLMTEDLTVFRAIV